MTRIRGGRGHTPVVSFLCVVVVLVLRLLLVLEDSLEFEDEEEDEDERPERLSKQDLLVNGDLRRPSR